MQFFLQEEACQQRFSLCGEGQTLDFPLVPAYPALWHAGPSLAIKRSGQVVVLRLTLTSRHQGSCLRLDSARIRCQDMFQADGFDGLIAVEEHPHYTLRLITSPSLEISLGQMSPSIRTPPHPHSSSECNSNLGPWKRKTPRIASHQTSTKRKARPKATSTHQTPPGPVHLAFHPRPSRNGPGTEQSLRWTSHPS